MRMISDIKIGITGLPGAGKTTALLRVIDMLKEAVEEHRAGAEANDDLTLMCIRLKEKNDQ